MKVQLKRATGSLCRHTLSITDRQDYSSFTPEELGYIRDTIDTYLANLPKPHVHAKLMALYAKDAAETDKPWERWEVRGTGGGMPWVSCDVSPSWAVYCLYRRKGGV